MLGDDDTGVPADLMSTGDFPAPVSEPASGPATFEVYGLDNPNCPDCLTRMEAEESSEGTPYWACTECGHVALV